MAENEVESGLNEQEAEIMDHLVQAWNLWCVYHADDGEVTGTFRQFREGICQCQQALGRIVLARQYPDFWRI